MEYSALQAFLTFLILDTALVAALLPLSGHWACKYTVSLANTISSSRYFHSHLEITDTWI